MTSQSKGVSDEQAALAGEDWSDIRRGITRLRAIRYNHPAAAIEKLAEAYAAFAEARTAPTPNDRDAVLQEGISRVECARAEMWHQREKAEDHLRIALEHLRALNPDAPNLKGANDGG